jgi:hypothetical protein
LTSPTKRKATTFDDDAENIDPIIFFSPKKSKGVDSTVAKPDNFFLTKAPPSPNDFSNVKPIVSPRRPIIPARSPAKLTTTSKTPLTAPAGRSPTRKRIGILNRRRTASPFTRIDPPKFGASSSGLGFSIDAALSGTISSYKAPVQPTLNIPELHVPQSKDSWFFDIHEDTEEELATNLMEHGACTLDISSDEESSARACEERGKENVPPMDDISQTRTVISQPEPSMAEGKARSRAARRRKEIDDGACDVDRAPLGALSAEDFYADGCDGESVFLIPAEVDPEEQEQELVVVSEPKGKEVEVDVDSLMQKDDFEMPRKAALLEPIEKAEEGFALWESGSADGHE